MRGAVVDTCVVVHIVQGRDTGRKCLAALRSLGPGIVVSVATVAELRSFALQNGWGAGKTERLNAILDEMARLDIREENTALMDAYVRVDAFSKRRAADGNGKMLAGSARKMGKNDLWIAACALALDLPLMTTDGDFAHLHGTLLEVVRVA